MNVVNGRPAREYLEEWVVVLTFDHTDEVEVVGSGYKTRREARSAKRIIQRTYPYSDLFVAKRMIVEG